MKLFSLLVALMALALPLGLVLSSPGSALVEDRGGATHAQAHAPSTQPAARTYAQR